MKKVSITVGLCILMMGCAERSLLEKEGEVLSFSQVNSNSNLKTIGEHSALLSVAYREAALEASGGQDIAAILTYLAAATFVGGAVGGASDTALANRALIGVSSTSVAGRTVSEDTIQGIYVAAKRMNCVSTTSRMGGFLLDGTSAATIGMARAATFGAIEEIKIITREALVREVADFTQIRDDLLAGATLSEEQGAGLERLASLKVMQPADLVLLNQYLNLLDNCLGASENVTSVEPITEEGSG
ncbi:hypothetical protein [Litoreibacter roseus]|uniref:Lipoprotein n=1 Tax=Litoreibacter roseus TaxID=2601869 RepID=A0A6N6JLP0_9RHOB|nr:hypothetical protein [Litoreibacter roseus]GFE66995.1 hypothetical protein KIN_40690 [Litoreibacter roseus]